MTENRVRIYKACEKARHDLCDREPGSNEEKAPGGRDGEPVKVHWENAQGPGLEYRRERTIGTGGGFGETMCSRWMERASQVKAALRGRPRSTRLPRRPPKRWKDSWQSSPQD